MSEEQTIDERLEQRIEALADRIDELARNVRLGSLQREINDLEARLRDLPVDIERVRERGYQFRAFLERQAEVLKEQWQDLARDAEAEIDDQSRRLRRELEDLEDQLRDLRDRFQERRRGAGKGAKPTPAAGTIKKPSKGKAKEKPSPKKLDSAPPKKKASGSDKKPPPIKGASHDFRDIEDDAQDLERKLDHLDDRLDDVESAIRRRFETLRENINRASKSIREANQTMDHAQEATFEFKMGEAPIVVAKAEWRNQDDNPNGILYLTDQRLIFEQKEKTGGFLGIGRKKVQEIGWEVAIPDIEKARAYDEGLLGRKDMVEVTAGGGAPFGQIVFEVKDANNEEWIRKINRARTGDILKEKLGSEDEAEIDLSEVPTQCPNCGGLLPEIMQGQKQLACEFCGTVIRF